MRGTHGYLFHFQWYPSSEILIELVYQKICLIIRNKKGLDRATDECSNDDSITVIFSKKTVANKLL